MSCFYVITYEKKAITTQKVSRWLLFPGSHILFIKDVLGIFYFKIPLYISPDKFFISENF